MNIKTISYDKKQGWSDDFPPMDSKQTLVLAFGAPSLIADEAVFNALAEAYPQAVITGCSSAGEILNGELFDDSLVVAIVRFEQTQLAFSSVSLGSAAASFEAGQELVKPLLADDLRGVFVLSEGLQVNGSQLIEGINSVCSKDVVVTGGLAGDGADFKRTWILVEGKPTPNFAAAVAFYGDRIVIGHGSKGGWELFGPERKVTASKDNILYTLDGKPALQLYKTYLGELAQELPASALRFPLALKDMPGAKKTLVRTILAVDEKTQSMIFAGNIPEGGTVQLMKANIDSLVEGAEDAALISKKRIPQEDGAVLSIAISCVGRRLILGEYTEDEIEATLDILPASTQQVGFYSYGELSPYACGSCDLHNQTMTLTTLYENTLSERDA